MKSNTTAAISSTQNITSSSNFLHKNEPVPGPSQQTENTRQEALQAWLIKTHNRLRFLSQIEHSVPFANLIASLDKELQPEAGTKNSIELILALDDFVEKEKNPSLSIQFFIEKILKNCRFLIDNYRNTYAKLIPLDLNKEKKQLQKSLLPDFELTRLIELTNDLKKFRLEHDRNFMHEIAMHEAELKSYTQELDEINEKTAKIEEELTFPITQLEANLKIKQRKLSYLQGDLYTLKQIRIDDIIEKLLLQLELENTRLYLISELEECDPIKILKTQIEDPKTKQEDLRSERKIKKDLTQNAQNLNVITEFFKDIIQLVLIKKNNIINNFLEKIQSTFDLALDKNALEAKQAKTNEESATPQEELVAFLQKNESALIEHLKELAEDKLDEITKLRFEKQNLEILGKKNILNKQISELLEKIQTIKNDQHIFCILEDNNLLKPLVYLERLQKIADNTIHEIDELQKQITEVAKQITELERNDKKDVAKLNSESNNEKIKYRPKIKNLENKKNKYIHELNAQLKKHNVEIQAEKDYRDPIQKKINEIRDIKITEWLSKLPQHERAFRFNSIDTKSLTIKIEKQKIKASHKKE